MAGEHGAGFVLEARGLGKCYDLSASRVRRLARALVGARGSSGPTEPSWALQDVSFQIAAGESFGVIGRNGAGKSTLLRLLAATARPTTGEVVRRGRHACLLDLGVGFHALETGRQNAETTLILQAGLTRAMARQRIEEIEEFAGLGEFFDLPIRVYSDGMRLRLAFATLTVLKPELLITDEVLVVGDEAFQERCSRWFENFLSAGGSLVLCSHDLWNVQHLCSRTMWLEGGRVAEEGPSRSVIESYRRVLGEEDEAAKAGSGTTHEVGATAGLAFEVVDLHLRDEGGEEVRVLPRDATVEVVADVSGQGAVPQLFVGITSASLEPVYGVASDMDGATPESLGGGRYRYRLWFDDLPLNPGDFRLRAHALDETGTRLYDTVEIHFSVEGEPAPGLVRPPVA